MTTYDAFAVAAPGLEPLVLRELRSLGVSSLKQTAGGVSFHCDALGLARTNLSLRTASRVLVRLGEFRATAFHELELGARHIEWRRVLRAESRARVRASCSKSKLYHSGAVAQRVEAEIARAVPGVVVERAGARDDEEEHEDIAQLIVVRVDHDRCTISADSSGALLHRRGYRMAVAKAPLRETLAAAMLMGAEYDASLPLVDPMCGSGTVAIEAAMMARRMAPGLQRSFVAEQWPEAEVLHWEAARETARGRILPKAPAPIVGSDRDAGAITAARANAERAGVANDIEFLQRPLSAFEPLADQGLLITNPPYGVRVGEAPKLRDLFARFGQVAREHAPGWRVAMLSANRELERQTRLPFDDVLATKNGGIPVRLTVANPAA